MRILLISLFSFTLTAMAQTTSWIGPSGAGQSWNTASNWSAGIPDSSSVANITNGNSAEIDGVAAAASLDLQLGTINAFASSTLTVGGNITLTGSNPPYGQFQAYENAHISAENVFLGGDGAVFRGGFYLNDNSSLVATSLTLRGTGGGDGDSHTNLEFYVRDTASLSLQTLTLQADISTGFTGLIFGVSNRNVSISGDVSLIGMDKTFADKTEIRVGSAGALSVGGSLSIIGNGIFFIDPPSDPAALPAFDITGSFNLPTLSTSPFLVSLESYAPREEGYRWTFLTADAGITGDLTSIQLGYAGNDPHWQLIKDGNSLSLLYSAVPEPSSFYLLALGFIGGGLALLRRHRV